MRNFLRMLNMGNNAGEFLTRKQVMDMLGISESTLYKWSKKGLPFIRVGRLVFIEKADLEKFLRKHKTS
jgi:excisionase family DNA binding protein